MSGERNFITAIVNAWKLGFPMYFPLSGTVESVKSIDKVLNVKTDDGILHDVTWTEPVTPTVGSKCLLVARNNSDKRYTAFAFNKIDEIKTSIAGQVDIEISADKAEISFKQQIKLTIDDTGFVITLPSGKTLKVDGDVLVTGKLDVEKEVTAKANSAAAVGVTTHITPYTDTPAGPAESLPPKAGT